MIEDVNSLPDFLIVGAQKSGTTALHRLLGFHPEVFVYPSELSFFSTSYLFQNGGEWYRQKILSAINKRYGNLNPNIVVGEKSPDYLYCTKSAQRIKNLNPSCKIIIILRNPVDRAYSHYHMSVINFRESQSFVNAIDGEKSRYPLNDSDWVDYNSPRWIYSYMDRGFYSNQIQAYLDNFPRDQIMFILTEDLHLRQEATLRDVFKFLEVDPEVLIPQEASGKASGISWRYRMLANFGLRHLNLSMRRYLQKRIFQNPRVKIEQDLRIKMSAIFKSDIIKTSALIGRDLSEWVEDRDSFSSN